MSSLLFLRPSPDQQRATFEHEARGEWGCALPLALEKHGLLDVREADPAILAERALIEAADAVLVGALRDGAWPDDAITAILSSPRPVLVEGPLPRRLREALGIVAGEPAAPPASLSVSDPRLYAAAAAYGVTPGGRLADPSVREVARRPEMDWEAIGTIPISVAQASAWRQRGWAVERWSGVTAGEVLAELALGDGRSAAIVRRGAVTACSFGLFGIIGQAHTAEPWGPGEFRSSPRIAGLEAVLLGLIDLMHRAGGRPRLRVLPWPRGAQWVLNVRHDFDRSLPAERVAELLEHHASSGTSATWYWRSRHLSGRRRRPLPARLRRHNGDAAVRVVAAHPRHEVALHTELLWTRARRERAAIERVIGGPIYGTCAHGDPECFRFQGAPNVLWAEREGLLYTELIQQSHYQPHRFAWLSDDGTVNPLAVVCLPHHESFDASMQAGHTYAESIRSAEQAFHAVGGMLQVMNHPDVHTDELFATLGKLPMEGRLDWTARDAARWWRRTHDASQLEVRSAGVEGWMLRSVEGVDDVSVEILGVDGARRSRLVHLPAGEPVSLRPPTPAEAPATS